MTLDPRAEMTLEQSRRTQEPSAADHARNLAALRERLGLPVPTATPGASAPVASAPLVSQLPAPRAAAAGGAARTKLAQLAGVAVTAAAIGFFVGSRFATPPVPPMPAVITPQRGTPPAPATTVTTPLAVNEPDVSSFNAGARAAFQPRASLERSASIQRGAAEGKRSQARRDEPAGGVGPNAKPARATADTSFMDAVRLLRRARGALSKGEPGFALALLDEIDQRFSRALLDEERGATRVLALCAHGRAAEARELARQLLARYPRSIYTPRIAQSCAGRVDIPPRNH